MFQLPSLTPTGDVRQDLEKMRRYIMAFQSELEQKLYNLSTDNFTSDYNSLKQGISVAAQDGSGTASENIAAHILNKNNPHEVTLLQAGAVSAVVTVKQDAWQSGDDGILYNDIEVPGVTVEIAPVIGVELPDEAQDQDAMLTDAQKIYRAKVTAQDNIRLFAKTLPAADIDLIVRV